jgi:hypothetical protein
MRTILSHFYNEEYLLPWWLKHHKKYFDHGIMVNQHSTDNSVEIIREICPDWEIIQSKNELFCCGGTDAEMEELERNLDGWRITLNTTEFLCGNYNYIENCGRDIILIKSAIMQDKVDRKDDKLSYDLPLIEQKPWGYFSSARPGRSMHCKSIPYRFGRHAEIHDTEDLIIFWYGWSPWTPETLKRKLQIQNRIPEHDKINGFARNHLTNAENLEMGFIKGNQIHPTLDMRNFFPSAY